MKILLTGATGFLGSEFIRLYSEHAEITAIVRNPESVSFSKNVHLVSADLENPLPSGLPEKTDAVIHLAQSRHYREFPDKAQDIHRINTAATLNLLAYARKSGAGHFFLASTGAVYGAATGEISEEAPLVPGNFYGLSKKQAEEIAGSFSHEMKITIFRFFFIYGPGQKGMMMPGLIDRIRQGKALTLAGERGLRLNPLYVSDAAEGIWTALQRGTTGIFNAAGPCATDLREIGEILGRHLGKKTLFETQPGGNGDYLASIRKMRHELGFQPLIKPEEGLKKTVEAESLTLSH